MAKGGAMVRALVLIGVHQTGGLQTLPAVTVGLQAMRNWGDSQGYPSDMLTELSDLDGTDVCLQDVFDAVDRYTQMGNVEQLIIYFCGHGMVNDGTEMWLLSGAPRNTNEAVHLAKSQRLATYGTIPYVVFISDCCRSAASSTTTDSVGGGAIFPSPTSDVTRIIDSFYACKLGQAGHQILDPDDVAAGYRAIFSEAVADALRGNCAQLLEPLAGDDDGCLVVRPHPLRNALGALVQQRIDELDATFTVTQAPDAILQSEEGVYWLSRLPPPPTEPATIEETIEEQVAFDESPAADQPEDLEWAEPALPGAPTPPDFSTETLLPTFEDPDVAAAEEAASRVATAVAEAVKEIEVGTEHGALAVVGAEFEVVWVGGRSQVSDEASGRVRISSGGGTAPTVLRLGPEPGGLSDWACVVIPVIPGHAVTVVVEEGQVVDAVYTSPGFSGDPAELRERTLIGASDARGLTWWDCTPEELLDEHASAAAIDPTLAACLAYTLDRLGRRDLVARLLRHDQPWPFDVALVADELDRAVTSPLPLLSRGWALLGGAGGYAPRPELPARLASPLTLFPVAALDAVVSYLSPQKQGAT